MKPSNPRVLIEELLHNARLSGNKPLEQRLTDLTIWFHHHKGSIPLDNLPTKVAFLEKSLWIMLEVAALLTERCHDLEHKGKPRRLFVPSGIKVDGNDYYR